MKRSSPFVRLFWVALVVAAIFYLWREVPWIGRLFLPEKAATPRTVAARGDLAADEKATIELFEKAKESVVFITTSQQVRDFWTRNIFTVPRGTGSGFIWDDRGHVVTNYHVVAGASEARVRLADGRDYKAALVGASRSHDLAVLLIGVGFKPPAPVPLGTSVDLKVGQKVFAIGNPFGLDWTLTTGIVSALDRSLAAENGATIEHLIQTDAAINPGNSGGALVDVAGNLVGINTAIYSRTGGNHGIGFAIPVSSARSIMEQIIASGAVTRGWIGVEAQEITSELADSFNLPDTAGALIAGVVRGSPADRAGIRPGDVLLSINGTTVTDPQVMLDLIAGLAPESEARFRLRRDTSIQELPIRIGKRPTLQAGE